MKLTISYASGQVGIISPRDYPILGLTIDPLTTFTSQSYIQIKQN